MSARRTVLGRALRLWPYLLVAFSYLATTPYHRGLNNPNEMVRLYMSAAAVDHDTFALEPVIRRWGMVDDKAIREGVLYSSKAPLQSLIGIPAYAVAAPILDALGVPRDKRTLLVVVRILGSAIFGIAFAWILLFWARRRAVELDAPRALGTALGLVAALGTMLYPYALTFTGHLLAAFAAGGCYLALVGLARARPGTPRWRTMAILAGFAGGATPFAEYPAALVAGPALVAAFVTAGPWRLRARLFGWLALGGAAPFALGLWAHDALWGSPLHTGYSFLENKGYVEVHGEGFFGVSFPKLDALGGSLFSPGTGLFFYSPVLLVGLAMLVLRVFWRRPAPVMAAAPGAGDAVPAELDEDEAPDYEPTQLPRALAVAALVGFLLSLYFISSHRGWRGGWTVGPRYIIAVAPVLWIWVVEAALNPRIRPWIAAFGVLSITLTGFAAALYPHLSDVYTNPIATFLWPSYLRGMSTYGIGHALGLEGHAANLVHVAPLVGALVYVAVAGAKDEPSGSEAVKPLAHRLAIVAGTFAMAIGFVFAIPEENPLAARQENRRLWGFWEPKGPDPEAERRRAGRLSSARAQWSRVTVEQLPPEGPPRPCRRTGPAACQYGDQPWQHFGPDILDMDGARERVLFMHPVAGAAVRATVPYAKGARVAELRYGLADASVTSDNDAPVEIRLRQGDRVLLAAEADNRFGLRSKEATLTSTLPISLEIRVARDGARVFGWDLHQYRE